MPRHADVLVPKRTWTILTDSADASITGVRMQNLSDFPIRVQATAAAVPPASMDGALLLMCGGDFLPATDTLENLFPGVTSPLHLWAWCENAAEVSVSHA